MKKFMMVLVCFMTIVVSANACGKDSTNYHPNVSFGESFGSVMSKIGKAYKLHGYYGEMERNLTNEKFVGNTQIKTYEFMGWGFFKYNRVPTKRGWLILTFKNKKLVGIETKTL